MEGRSPAKTTIYRVDRDNPESEFLAEASSIIRAGGLVVFPTETVYGLGADALNPYAVERIFRVKGRPPDNPLIVHIAVHDDLFILGKGIDWRAEALAKKFWPGPLTLVVPRSNKLPAITVAGLDTVAIRMPRHPVALGLIRLSGVPIAAPSANLSGRPSPTTADHVIRDLADRVDAILDAGPTDIGVESTVIDLTSEPPQVLRPGGVTVEELRAVVGEVDLHPLVTGAPIGDLVAKSPGMKYRHYAPRAKVVVVVGEAGEIKQAVQLLAAHLRRRFRVGVLGTDGHRYEADALRDLGPRSSPSGAAQRLFRYLRELDDEGVDIIVAEGWPEEGIGLAIMNRLRKAAGGLVIPADRVLRETPTISSYLRYGVMGT